MPKVLEDRRKAIARSNPKLSESSTWAIATSALQKEGKMHNKGGPVVKMGRSEGSFAQGGPPLPRSERYNG